jgi:hypothetical protein
MLEDHSTNGTVVGGVTLRSRRGFNSSVDCRQPLKQGSVIVVATTPPEEDYRFTVHIPQRDIEYEKAYQQNLTAYFLRMRHVQLENEESV